VKNMTAEQFQQFNKDVEQLNFKSFSSHLPSQLTV
jgi:hypothetical protein